MKTRIELTSALYHDFGKRGNGHPSFRLYVSPDLVKTDKRRGGLFFEFPAPNVSLYPDPEDPTVFHLKPSRGKNVFLIQIQPGYGGGSSYEILSQENIIAALPFVVKDQSTHSTSRGALVVTPQQQIIYRWGRTGQLFGCTPTGIRLQTLAGEEFPISQEELSKHVRTTHQ